MFCTAVKNTSEKKLYKNNPNLNRFSLFGGCIFFFWWRLGVRFRIFFFFRFIFSILHGMADLFVLFSLGTVVSDAAHTTVLLYIHIYNIYISIRIRVMLFDADPSFMCVSRPTVQKRFCLRSFFFFFFFFGFCVLKKRNRAGEFVTSTPARVMWFFFFASL